VLVKKREEYEGRNRKSSPRDVSDYEFTTATTTLPTPSHTRKRRGRAIDDRKRNYYS